MKRCKRMSIGRPFFDYYIISGVLKVNKPDRAIYEHLIAVSDTKPSRSCLSMTLCTISKPPRRGGHPCDPLPGDGRPDPHPAEKCLPWYEHGIHDRNEAGRHRRFNAFRRLKALHGKNFGLKRLRLTASSGDRRLYQVIIQRTPARSWLVCLFRLDEDLPFPLYLSDSRKSPFWIPITHSLHM